MFVAWERQPILLYPTADDAKQRESEGTLPAPHKPRPASMDVRSCQRISLYVDPEIDTWTATIRATRPPRTVVLVRV